MMEYTLKDRKTEINLLTNELKKTQQEMEVLQTRIHSYEVIIYRIYLLNFHNFSKQKLTFSRWDLWI